MKFMVIFVVLVVLDVLLMSTVLARPDKTMRSIKYIRDLKSASRNVKSDREDNGFNGEHDGMNTGHKLIPKRLLPPPPQITTRREYGVRHSDACLTKTEELNPKTYFNTDDNFTPASYKTTVCTGSIGQRGYPNCVYGRLDCVTLKEDMTFIRKPGADCGSWSTAVIKDVPVGCQCMWPY